MAIIMLCGEDSYRLKNRLNELVAGFGKKYDSSGLNTLRLSGARAGFGEVREALRSAGFLSSRRLVAVDGLFAARKAEEFIDFFKKPELIGENALILSEIASMQELEKDPVFKILSGSEIRIEEFSPLRPPALAAWIKNEVKKTGSAIEPGAVTALERLVGNDLWLMRQEIGKLSAFARGRTITRQDIEKMLNIVAEDNIFELMDALGARDGKRTSLTLHRELDAGGPQFLISMLVRQFRILLLLQEYKQKEPDLGEAALAKLIGAHPFVVKKSLQILRLFPKNELVFIWGQLLNLDRSIKKGVKKPAAAFDIFIGTLFTKTVS